VEVSNHPLLSNKQRQIILEKVEKQEKLKSSAAFDPLSNPLGPSKIQNETVLDPLLNTMNIIDDPLSSFAKGKESKNENLEIIKKAAQELHEDKLKTPWQLKKLQILKDFSMSGNITLSSNVINEFAGSGVEDGSGARHLDKYTQRLASLVKRQVSQEKVELSQKEYEDHITKLSTDLNRAWANDERVNSLKIVIQLAKLLSDTTVPQFYPIMFVLVTNVLERFGEMVYNRLKTRAEEALNETGGQNKKLKLDEFFVPNEVPAIAKETCRNWFYKISCIRDLIPRIYVEICLFKCYRFISNAADFTSILSKLGSIIRGH
jgi:hypothetical protein